MSAKLDISQLENYYENMKKLTDDFDDFLKDFLIEMALRVIAKTKPRTPIDTGALRNAWQITDIEGSGTDIYVYFNNPMEYATEIEYGHRIMGGENRNTEVGWYEGRFMLTTSIDEVRNQIPARYNQQLQIFCNKHGIYYD